VITVPAGVRVLVATKPVDFRRGADSLAALAQEELQRDPFSGTIIVFRSKRTDSLKILAWVRPDFVLEAARGRRVSLAADQRRRDAAVGFAALRADRWPGLVSPSRAGYSNAGDRVVKPVLRG
jgi:transposase